MGDSTKKKTIRLDFSHHYFLCTWLNGYTAGHNFCRNANKKQRHIAADLTFLAPTRIGPYIRWEIESRWRQCAKIEIAAWLATLECMCVRAR